MHIFNRVKFRTPESVELEFTLAGIGNRAWALLIDYLVLSVILILFLIAWITVFIQLADLWKFIFRDQAGFWLVAIAFLIGFAIYVGYFVFFETLWQGQTPGKRFAKIRVVRDDGRPIGLQQATLRALLRPFDEVLFIGAILIMFSNQEKRLGDLAAGTIVIQTQTPTTSTTLTISEQAKSVSEQLLQIADLSAMLPDDFAVIREYLHRRPAMAPKARTSVALQLAKDVKAIIHLENIPEAVTPDVFLEAIYLAYQKFSNFSH
ncbi:RDD family protein [Brasilonema bromeliae]|uniref:RDD family protein n=1 Tax=Brasilonema bromeliae SPC951 TaxID=385972 RepID=A0ABX1P3G4_9CYAN|nr:RDD family protein [Brasilonema bromeliae]NMG18884.1 RDD family protein [Brasilonema bromeliae SPC951]